MPATVCRLTFFLGTSFPSSIHDEVLASQLRSLLTTRFLPRPLNSSSSTHPPTVLCFTKSFNWVHSDV